MFTPLLLLLSDVEGGVNDDEEEEGEEELDGEEQPDLSLRRAMSLGAIGAAETIADSRRVVVTALNLIVGGLRCVLWIVQ